VRKQTMRLISALVLTLFSAIPATCQVSVLTQHNDNARTGQNLNETVLNTSNVNQNGFGKLFWRTVDGFIYAQPLYAPGLTIQGATHNVVYVATQHNSVYAFDADDPNAPAPLWQVNLGTPVPSQDICIITGDTNPGDCPYYDISPEIGITSTPVIDTSTGIIYVVNRTKNTSNNSYHDFLHALDLLTGAERLAGPVEVTGQVNGTGAASQSGILTFDPTFHLQRPSLLLAGGVLYVCFGSVGDIGTYHGWVMTYNAATLQQEAIISITPNGTEGGIWSAGQGPVADAAGNIYIMTGNGDFSANSGGKDYGDSFLKFSGPTLAVTDYFTPSNQGTLNANNTDLGSGGPMLLPGTSVLVGIGKDGVFRVVNTNSMGEFNSSVDNDVQEFNALSKAFLSSPVYWNSPNNGPLVYIWGAADFLKAYQFNGSRFNTSPVSQGTIQNSTAFANAAALSVSADGSQLGSGIVWSSASISLWASGVQVPGVVRAFDATNLTNELWDSTQNLARDDVGGYAKFSPPTIANGKVYVGSFSGQLQVYGLNPPAFQGIRFAQVASATPQTTTASVPVTYPGPQTAGNLNVVIVGWHDSAATVQSVTDSSGNTYALAIGPTTGTALRQSIYYAKNILSSSANTVTITFNQGATQPDVRVLEYSGVNQSNPLDVSAGASGNSNVADSGSATTTAANELIVGANTITSNTTIMAGAPFTPRIITSPYSDVVNDRVVNLPGSYHSWAPLNASGAWVEQVVTFRAAGASTVPFVSSVSPNSGPAAGGTAVTITGTNFATGATVTFGSAAATNVVVVNSTTITATTPAGSAGAVTVTVTVSGQSGSLASGFTYVVAPTVSSVSPNSGSTAGGTAVTITGTNFVAGATVKFGATTATNVVVVNSTTITATTPAGSAGAVTVTVTVSGQSGSLASGFTYGVAPTVSSVSPNSGSTAGGTAVTITGTNFATGATVKFGATAATNVVVVNGTTITATTPAGSGAVTVTVTNSNGQSGSLTNGFTYTGTVTISFGQVASATPQSPTATVAVTYPAAQTAGDLNVVVVGWNDTTATVQSVKDSAGNTYSLAIGPTIGVGLQQSIYYAPGIAGGNNTVTVTFSQAAAFPDVRILEYRGVTTLDVTAGASGNSASASSGAATTTSANELIFGANTVATFTAAAGSGFTSRIITSPDGDIAEDKLVTTAGSNSTTATLTGSGPWVMQMATFSAVSGPVPTVSSVSPNSGSTAGGTAVTIIGTNFATGATVKFGATAATNVTVVNGTTITATTPAGSAGAATVTVTNPGGQSGSLTSAFTYVVAPTVSSVSPNSGSTAGGTAVTITGTNFATGATVTFGSAAATNVVVVNSTTITATTPAGSAGAATLTVTNNNGLSGSLASAFTYLGSPTVSGVSPNNGATAGGTAVTITGTNFVAGATVTFGSAAATNVVVVNGATITATTPSGSDGAVTVTVTVSGQSGSLANGFTYMTTVVAVTTPGNFAGTLMGTSAPTYVAGQEYYNATPSTSFTSSPFNSTGADLLVMFLGCHNRTVFTIADSYGNTWLPLAGPAFKVGSSYYPMEGELFYAPNAITGTSHTITVGLSQTEPLVMSIAALSGDNIYSPIDAYSSITGDNGSIAKYIASTPLITSQPNDYLLGIVKGFGNTTYTAGTGYTTQSASTGPNFSAEGQTASSIGSYSSSFAASVGDFWQTVIAAIAPKPSETVLSWAASSGGIIANYYIERCTGLGCFNFSQIATASGSTLTYTDPTISSGAVYNYRVRAQNSVGTYSAYSNVLAFSPITPYVVSSFVATPARKLSWNASAESGGSIKQYSIERCTGFGCTNFSEISTTVGTSYADTTAAAGTTYNYRVRAQDMNNFYGPYSVVATASVPAWFDNAADGGNNGGNTTSLTYPFTVGTSSNRLLLVNLVGESSDDISSVTYAGAPMTLIKKVQAPNSDWHYLYYLLAPISGTNDIVITAASSHYLISEAASWYNITQLGQPTASTTNSAPGGLVSMTTSLPASSNNAIVAESIWAPLGVLPAGGSSALVADSGFQSLGMFSSVPSPVTQAFPVSMTNTWGGQSSASSIMASFSLASNGTAGITYDNSVDGGNNGGSTASLTYSYTVGSGQNRLLLVNLVGDTLADDISSVTYAGTSMILIGKVQTPSNNWQYLYYLLNPSSGSHNIVVNAASSHYLISQAASWYNVKQAAQPDASTINTAATTSTSITTSLTTVATGSLVVQGLWSYGHLAAGVGATPIVTDATFDGAGIFASSGSPVSPAGNVSMTAISDGTLSSGAIMVSFAPAP
jgi:hypothetical protein